MALAHFDAATEEIVAVADYLTSDDSGSPLITNAPRVFFHVGNAEPDRSTSRLGSGAAGNTRGRCYRRSSRLGRKVAGWNAELTYPETDPSLESFVGSGIDGAPCSPECVERLSEKG